VRVEEIYSARDFLFDTHRMKDSYDVVMEEENQNYHVYVLYHDHVLVVGKLTLKEIVVVEGEIENLFYDYVEKERSFEESEEGVVVVVELELVR
jgi:hypothetical protein